MIQQMLEIWSVVPLPFLNPAWTSGSSRFMYCWSLAWRILSVTLLACEMRNGKWKLKTLVTRLCWTLRDLMDYSPPGCSIHGILQARILEWVAMSFSRRSSQPRDRTQVFWLAGEFFTTEPPGKSTPVVVLTPMWHASHSIIMLEESSLNPCPCPHLETTPCYPMSPHVF